nr:FtsW/RodA/SpoVE family cell cycle protein [Bacillus sp. JCM 19034]
MDYLISSVKLFQLHILISCFLISSTLLVGYSELVCVVSFLLFFWHLATNAFRTKDPYGRLLIIGGVAILAVPTFWNILMGFGFVPIIGMSLPFISYGGSMLFLYSTVLGLILSVYRRKDIVEPTIS